MKNANTVTRAETRAAARAARAAAKAAARLEHKKQVMQARIELFKQYLQEYTARIQAGEMLELSISFKNDKMGPVPSVSTLPFLTCPAICRDTCGVDCYAAKMAANLSRPSVINTWARNTAILINQPDRFWAAVSDAVKGFRFFRYHVAGDIFGIPYFQHMIEIARNNPACEFLAFTKAFNTVNGWIRKNGQLPNNLHILFSGWYDMKPNNPYNLPETNVLDRGDEIPEGWTICGGCCYDCACRGTGCWTVKNGETIAFYKH